MRIVEVNTKLPIISLPMPAQSFTYDGQNRLSGSVFTYVSVIVSYTVTWNGTAIQVNNLSQSITDN